MVGWSSATSYRIDPLFTQNVQFGDAKGDGLIDLIQGNGSSHKVFINQGDGTGWEEDTNYSVPIEFTDIGRWVVDVNKDGLDDLVISVSTSTGGGGYAAEGKAYINRGDGTGWDYDAHYTIPIDFAVDGVDKGVRIADVTKDGYPDIVVSRDSYHRVYANNGDGSGWT